MVAFLGIQHLLPEVADPSRSTALSYQEFPAQFFKPKSLPTRIEFEDSEEQFDYSNCSTKSTGTRLPKLAVAPLWVGWTVVAVMKPVSWLGGHLDRLENSGRENANRKWKC